MTGNTEKCIKSPLNSGSFTESTVRCCFPTCSCGVVSIPEYVGLHRDSSPWWLLCLLLGVEAETRLKITVGDRGIKSWLCRINAQKPQVNVGETLLWLLFSPLNICIRFHVNICRPWRMNPILIMVILIFLIYMQTPKFWYMKDFMTLLLLGFGALRY